MAASSPQGERATTTTKTKQTHFQSLHLMSKWLKATDTDSSAQASLRNTRIAWNSGPHTVGSQNTRAECWPQQEKMLSKTKVESSWRGQRKTRKDGAKEVIKTQIKTVKSTWVGLSHSIFRGFQVFLNTEVYLIYNVVLISGVQQGNSVIYVCVCVL